MPFPSFPEEQLYACGKLQPPQASLLDAIVIFSLQRLGSNRGPFSLQTLTFRWLIDEKGRDDLTQCSVTRVIFQVMILLGEKRTSRNRIQFLHWCLQTLYQTQMYFLPSFLSSWLLSSVLWRDSGPERSREADEWNPSGPLWCYPSPSQCSFWTCASEKLQEQQVQPKPMRTYGFNHVMREWTCLVVLLFFWMLVFLALFILMCPVQASSVFIADVWDWKHILSASGMTWLKRL